MPYLSNKPLSSAVYRCTKPLETAQVEVLKLKNLFTRFGQVRIGERNGGNQGENEDDDSYLHDS
jgi:hypothetical protein